MAEEKKEIPESRLVKILKGKCEKTLGKIETLAEMRAADKMVDYVYTVGRNMFDKPLDQLGVEELLAIGGKLTGIYAYFGNRCAYSRAERDVYEQKLAEMTKELALDYYEDTKKITHAKAKAELEVSELADFVVLKEFGKNNWENLTDAVKTMIMFVQSTIKVKEGERFSNARLHDQG